MNKTKQSVIAYGWSVASLLVILLQPADVLAQFHAVDGNNCNSSNGVEWSVSSSKVDVDITPVTPGSANLLRYWGGVQGTKFVMAIERESKGNSFFAIYLNKDCNSLNNDISKGGADIALLFDLNGGIIQDFKIYNYNATTLSYVAGTKTFVGKLGNSICTDTKTAEAFMEISMTLTDIFDMCNTTGVNTCGNITVTYVNTHAGGSTSSGIKDEFYVNTVSVTNRPPKANIGATDSVACKSESLVLNGSKSLYGDEGKGTGDTITSYLWDMDYNGTFSTDFTGQTVNTSIATNGAHTVALIVTDKFNCKDTGISTINVYGRPVANGTIGYNAAPAPNCTTLTYDGLTSVDNTGTNNLLYNWDFGDGNSSTSASGTHIYPSCSIYNGMFSVSDPDNNGKCPALPLAFTAALPVELISFDVTLTAVNRVELNWSTASEQNNKGFTILKSTNGVNWVDMDFVPGNGNSNEVINYKWTDVSINQTKIVYYRLKQEDFNGEVSFSEYRKVSVGQVNAPVVYPNPVVNKLNINFGSVEESQSVQVTVWNQYGQQVYTQTIVGLNEYAIDLSNIFSGVYHLQVNTNDQTFSQTFIKQ